MDNIDSYELDESVPIGNASRGSRKRQKNPSKRELEKKRRYNPPGRGIFTPCSTIHNSVKFRCSDIRPADVKMFRDKLYEKPDKTVQDNFVALHIETKEVKRRRPAQQPELMQKVTGTPHKCSASYFINTCDGGKVLVCLKLFQSISKIGAFRLKSIVNKVNLKIPIKETRGGDKVSHKCSDKKKSIMEFIKRLKACESHYGRKKSKRLYLHPELNIAKLCKFYNASVEESLRTQSSMFRNVFNTKFNLGFKSPASDVCTHCTLLTEKLKKAVHGSTEEKNLMTEKRIHKLRARAFYELLRQPDDKKTITYVFDLQQIQPLPKSPIQEAYYSRQLNFYSLCIVDQKGKDPHFFVWTENLAGKGSAEISNALLHFLTHSAQLQNKKNLRLFADGCVAQNKNNINVQTLLHFLLNNKGHNLKFITLHFPVRGHSFLPADRVFGRVEKMLRKKPTMFSQDDYINLYQRVGQVYKLGSDWKLYDTKSLKKIYKPLPNISALKRIALKRFKTKVGHYSVSFKGLMDYRFEDETINRFKSPFQRGNNANSAAEFNLDISPLSHPISREKVQDIKKLLTLILGENWESRDEDFIKWYCDVLSMETELTEDEEICDCLDEETALHI